MIWRHDPSNASSRQDKSRTACLAKNNPVLNCAEALTCCSDRIGWLVDTRVGSVENNDASLIEPITVGAGCPIGDF
jgi:hypothetical protein